MGQLTSGDSPGSGLDLSREWALILERTPGTRVVDRRVKRCSGFTRDHVVPANDPGGGSFGVSRQGRCRDDPGSPRTRPQVEAPRRMRTGPVDLVKSRATDPRRQRALGRAPGWPMPPLGAKTFRIGRKATAQTRASQLSGGTMQLRTRSTGREARRIRM